MDDFRAVVVTFFGSMRGLRFCLALHKIVVVIIFLGRIWNTL